MSNTFAYTCYSESTKFTARQTFRAVNLDTAREIIARWNREAKGAYAYALVAQDGKKTEIGAGDAVITRLLQSPFDVICVDNGMAFVRGEKNGFGYVEHTLIHVDLLARRTLAEPMHGRKIV